MIHASRLTKIYGDASSGIKAIDGLNLKIEPGQRVALLGRSGSGKTTLMNILAGLDRPSSGELIAAGKSLFELSPQEIAHYRQTCVHRRNHTPAQMSGGEQQRVAIARAIVSKPPLLLADEPTGNLDSQTADRVTQLMLDVVAENNATLVLITHDQKLAETCATRTIHMQDGRFISDDVEAPA